MSWSSSCYLHTPSRGTLGPCAHTSRGWTPPAVCGSGWGRKESGWSGWGRKESGWSGWWGGRSLGGQSGGVEVMESPTSREPHAHIAHAWRGITNKPWATWYMHRGASAAVSQTTTSITADWCSSPEPSLHQCTLPCGRIQQGL